MSAAKGVDPGRVVFPNGDIWVRAGELEYRIPVGTAMPADHPFVERFPELFTSEAPGFWAHIDFTLTGYERV